jgi:hypothetical protein
MVMRSKPTIVLVLNFRQPRMVHAVGGLRADDEEPPVAAMARCAPERVGGTRCRIAQQHD